MIPLWPGGAGKGSAMYSQIYVPVDNSEHSNQAVEISVALAQAFHRGTGGTWHREDKPSAPYLPSRPWARAPVLQNPYQPAIERYSTDRSANRLGWIGSTGHTLTAGTSPQLLLAPRTPAGDPTHAGNWLSLPPLVYTSEYRLWQNLAKNSQLGVSPGPARKCIQLRDQRPQHV